MKEICLLIVLIQLAFSAFENTFKFQYLGSNLPNIQDSVQIYQNKKSVSLILPFGQPYLKLASLNYSLPFSYGTYEIYMVTTRDKVYQKIMFENKFEFRIQPYFGVGISIYSKVNWKINDSNSLSFRYSKQRKKEI